jgi:hypothetical protein
MPTYAGVFARDSGDVISNGRLFRNGLPFGGKLQAVNGQVAWGNESYTIPNGSSVNGEVFFTAGRVAHGLIGSKYYVRGVVDLTAGIKNQTLKFNNGLLANGVIANVTYSNGLIV